MDIQLMDIIGEGKHIVYKNSIQSYRNLWLVYMHAGERNQVYQAKLQKPIVKTHYHVESSTKVAVKTLKGM